MTAAFHPMTSLVGRDRELATLRQALDAALAGRGSLVLIGGEAGIGKTTLVEANLGEATGQGALALVGRCYDLSETPPYGPWAEALAHAQREHRPTAPPDLGGGGAASQAELFAATRDYLATLAATRPTVLFLDDLHWADVASLELLRVIARNLATLPLLLLATYRAEEVARGHPFYQLLPALVREARAERLDLRRLEAGDLRALVRGRYGLVPADEDRLVAYLIERSEGNPLFAGELLRALEEGRALRRGAHAWVLGDLAAVGLPALLRQVLDARLDRLGEAARDLLAVAAVIGQDVPFALWRAVAAVDEEPLFATAERAMLAHLLAELPGGRGARFAHALIREALYVGLLPTRRRLLHRRVAEALLAAPRPAPDIVADHLYRAGDDRASEWLVRAGDRAERAYAQLTAAERLILAAALLEAREGAASERGWLLLRAGDLLTFGDPQRGLEALETALSLAIAARDRTLEVACLHHRGQVRCLLLDFRGGLADLGASVAAWETLPQAGRARLADPRTPDVCPARIDRAPWLAHAGRYREGLAEAEYCLAAAPIPGPEAYAFGEQARGRALAGLGRPEEVRGALARSRAAYRAAGNHALVGDTALAELEYVVQFQADRPDERAALVAEGAEGWGKAENAFSTRWPRFPELPLLMIEGRWDEAAMLAADLRAPGSPPSFRFIGATLLAQLARERGDASAAWDAVREALPDGPGSAPGSTRLFYALPVQRVAAQLALDAGDVPTARAWLESHDRWLGWSDGILWHAEGALAWAAYHRAAGSPSQAQDHAGRALARASDPRQPLALLAAHRALGEFAVAEGRHADAAGALAEALALAGACAAPYERALTLLALAELRAATLDKDGARAALDEARDLLLPLAARPALARAEAIAARLTPDALPAPAPAGTPPVGLSLREVQVLRLVAAGLTNAQAAERLYLSPRTVDQHLRSIYNKLGVSSRAAAARWAAEHGLTGDTT